MEPVWQILHQAGVPLAAGRRSEAPTPSAETIASAVRAAIAATPAGREREALAAFLLAWKQGWPQAFQDAFATDADRVVAWATAGLTDENRYLKLRRIALENLAAVL